MSNFNTKKKNSGDFQDFYMTDNRIMGINVYMEEEELPVIIIFSTLIRRRKFEP